MGRYIIRYELGVAVIKYCLVLGLLLASCHSRPIATTQLKSGIIVTGRYYENSGEGYILNDGKAYHVRIIKD